MPHQILHGVATLSIMSYFCEYGVPEIIVPMLLMEVSASSFCGRKIDSGSSVTVGLLTKSFALCTVHSIWCFAWYRTWQISTINLVFMGAGAYMSENATILNIAIFTVNFTIFRMVICPQLWWGIFTATWENRNNPISQACLPWHFSYVVFVFGESARSVTIRWDVMWCDESK